MSKIEVKKITNANIYLDGNNLLGRAEEVSLPTVKAKMVDHAALGLVGVPEFPSGIEKLDGGKIKWASLYPEVFAKAANPFVVYDLQVRGNLETYNSRGRVSEEPVVALLSASFKTLPMGQYKPRDNAEFETDLAVHYIKLIAGGIEVLEIDVLANIWRANGMDMLTNYRANIGA